MAATPHPASRGAEAGPELLTVSQAKVPHNAGIDHVRNPSGPPSMPVGFEFIHRKLNHHDRRMCSIPETTAYEIRTLAEAAITGRIQSDVAAMCSSVWNRLRLPSVARTRNQCSV